MAIQARTIVGVASAFAVAGAALWVFSPPAGQEARGGHVEVTQVEVKDLDAATAAVDSTHTAANR